MDVMYHNTYYIDVNYCVMLSLSRIFVTLMVFVFILRFLLTFLSTFL